jgi:hypothetical protein
MTDSTDDQVPPGDPLKGSPVAGPPVESPPVESPPVEAPPVEGPLSLELLADLHAGVFDREVAARLHRRVAADAQARTVLAALDATVVDLAALSRRDVALPDAVALRLDAALAAEAQRRDRPAPDPPGNDGDIPATGVTDLSARRRRIGWSGLGLVAAAAMVVAALWGVPPMIPGTPRASDALGTATGVQPSEDRMALSSDALDGALAQALTTSDYGPLSPPEMMQDCLEANGAAAGTKPLGAMEVTLDGREGVLIVLPTGQAAQFRMLVVGPDCAPGNPSPMADDVVGR